MKNKKIIVFNRLLRNESLKFGAKDLRQKNIYIVYRESLDKKILLDYDLK